MLKSLIFFLHFPWISSQREQQQSSHTISPTDCETCSLQQRQWNSSWLNAYFELSLISLKLHIVHCNKKDLSDTTNLPTAGPDWIDLRLQKGCLESGTILMLDESLIHVVLWKTARAPAKDNLMFCQLSAALEGVCWRKPWAQFFPAMAVGVGWYLPIPPYMTVHDYDLSKVPVREQCHSPASTAVLTVGTVEEGTWNQKLAAKCWSSSVLLKQGN